MLCLKSQEADGNILVREATITRHSSAGTWQTFHWHRSQLGLFSVQSPRPSPGLLPQPPLESYLMHPNPGHGPPFTASVAARAFSPEHMSDNYFLNKFGTRLFILNRDNVM